MSLGSSTLSLSLIAVTIVIQVFEETLRMYPPAGSVVKKAPPGLVLGGYSIPTGTMVGVSA